MPKWLPGKVEERVSKTSFLINSDATGRLISRHISDLHPAEISHKFSSTENAETGFKKLMGEVTGATQELEKPEEQLDAALNNKDVMEEVDEKMRQNFEDTNPELVAQDVRPKEKIKKKEDQPVRRSKRLQGKEPE